VTNQLAGHEDPSSFAQAVSRMSGTSKWVRAAIGYGFLIPSLIFFFFFIIIFLFPLFFIFFIFY